MLCFCLELYNIYQTELKNYIVISNMNENFNWRRKNHAQYSLPVQNAVHVLFLLPDVSSCALLSESKWITAASVPAYFPALWTYFGINCTMRGYLEDCYWRRFCYRPGNSTCSSCSTLSLLLCYLFCRRDSIYFFLTIRRCIIRDIHVCRKELHLCATTDRCCRGNRIMGGYFTVGHVWTMLFPLFYLQIQTTPPILLRSPSAKANYAAFCS